MRIATRGAWGHTHSHPGRPLVIAHGAGAEMRRTLGTAVFAGMLGVTLFGLVLTPVFYSVIRRLFGHPAPVPDPSAAPSRAPTTRGAAPVPART